MARLRKGRAEKNQPKVSAEELMRAVQLLYDAQGHAPHPEQDGFWGFYKTLLLVPPALAFVTGRPVSIYGVGTFRVKTLGNGKKVFRARYSPSVSGFSSLKDFALTGDFEKDFWKVMLSFVNFGDDASVIEENRLTLGVKEASDK